MIQCEKKGNSFVALDENQKEAGNITWFALKDNVIDVDHTYVDDAYRGQGIAKKLLQCVIEMVKADGLTIIPSCSYAAKVLKSSDEYQNLLA